MKYTMIRHKNRMLIVQSDEKQWFMDHMFADGVIMMEGTKEELERIFGIIIDEQHVNRIPEKYRDDK